MEKSFETRYGGMVVAVEVILLGEASYRPTAVAPFRHFDPT